MMAAAPRFLEPEREIERLHGHGLEPAGQRHPAALLIDLDRDGAGKFSAGLTRKFRLLQGHGRQHHALDAFGKPVLDSLQTADAAA